MDNFNPTNSNSWFFCLATGKNAEIEAPVTGTIIEIDIAEYLDQCQHSLGAMLTRMWRMDWKDAIMAAIECSEWLMSNELLEGYNARDINKAMEIAVDQYMNGLEGYQDQLELNGYVETPTIKFLLAANLEGTPLIKHYSDELDRVIHRVPACYIDVYVNALTDLMDNSVTLELSTNTCEVPYGLTPNTYTVSYAAIIRDRGQFVSEHIFCPILWDSSLSSGYDAEFTEECCNYVASFDATQPWMVIYDNDPEIKSWNLEQTCDGFIGLSSSSMDAEEYVDYQYSLYDFEEDNDDDDDF